MSAATVASFITTSCSTAVVVGLSNQIATEIGCMSPSSLVRFAAGSGITFNSNAVLPFLAANAKSDLQKVGNVQLNSAFRTVAQQFLIVEWFNRGRCGITAAAAPGRSNHESGRAVDVANFSARVTAMANHGWAHDVPGDPVHFDHLSSADIRGKDTLAFQRLWNRNHPSDKIAEDGDYGPQTEARLRQSPATGFAI
ncbi:MAG TPA: M15 family metallopeptidase, partial [Kofleriaceae bacterium]|nr:M15 family metallopeptidase [Kofleriaceae bacterium]